MMFDPSFDDFNSVSSMHFKLQQLKDHLMNPEEEKRLKNERRIAKIKRKLENIPQKTTTAI